jgi:hypothetical protein
MLAITDLPNARLLKNQRLECLKHRAGTLGQAYLPNMICDPLIWSSVRNAI